MANITVVSTGGKNALPVRTFNTEAAASILEGHLVKIGGTGNNFVIELATADPEIGTDRVLGIAKAASTDTASVAGTCEVYIIDSRTVLRANAHTPANLGDGILFDSVTIDLTSTTQTINENEGDDPDVHGIIMLAYSTEDGTVDFVIKNGALLDGLV